MRWRTVRVDDSSIVPSMRSVVVRSPVVTVAVLKIDAVLHDRRGSRRQKTTAAVAATTTMRRIETMTRRARFLVGNMDMSVPRSASVGGSRAARAAG